MILDSNINYIVSGLERSGTSLLMQILDAGAVPCGFDSSRKADDNNPKGYYELEGGKIINKIIDGSFPFEKFKGKFIKITSYGIKFLPPGRYNVIYSERKISEILDSMQKMARIDNEDRKETNQAFTRLNNMIKNKISSAENIDCLFVNYNEILDFPVENIRKIHQYLNIPDIKFDDMLNVVDDRLYRNR